MGLKVIGIDPHKRSHTAVVLDQDEEIAAQLRVAADRRQTDRPAPPRRTRSSGCRAIDPPREGLMQRHDMGAHNPWTGV